MMKSAGKKILFSGGGTLGPVTPLLAVMQEIRRMRDDVECLFVGTPDGPERGLVEAEGFRFLALRAPKLRRYFSLHTLVLPFAFAWALARAVGLLARERPGVVVGAGGYTSVPVGLAAKLTGARLLIHQQDVAPSLSNTLLAPFADAVSVTFERSLKDFPGRKTMLTGNPVRTEFESADRARGRSRLKLTEERPLVLAVGGGTGSAFLNELIVAASPLWTGFADLAHITGPGKDFGRLPALTHPERYHHLAFAGPELADYFAAADIVITRAGLGTLTELAALAKPVVLVPIPDSHQQENAAYVVERGAGRMFRELDLTPEQLVTFVRELLKKPDDAYRLGRNLHDLFVPGAREALAGKVLALAGLEV